MLYLDWANVSRADLTTVRSALELTCVDIVAETLDTDGEAQLREVLANEAALALKGERLPYELHILLGRLTGSTVLALFVETLVGLTMSHTEAFPIERDSIEEVQGIHVRIVEALVDRDAETAKRVLSEHLAGSQFPPRGMAADRDDPVTTPPATASAVADDAGGRVLANGLS
jgi:DNA-binding FadR family transcriptional regulator